MPWGEPVEPFLNKTICLYHINACHLWLHARFGVSGGTLLGIAGKHMPAQEGHPANRRAQNVLAMSDERRERPSFTFSLKSTFDICRGRPRTPRRNLCSDFSGGSLSSMRLSSCSRLTSRRERFSFQVDQW